MASPKPTILLIPGAFTTGACYKDLIPHLEKAGYPIVTVPKLAATLPPDPLVCTAGDTSKDLIENHLLPLIRDKKEVIVFAHSLGATTLATDEPEPLLKSTRAPQTGGVIGIIYISFAFVPTGKSQFEFLEVGDEMPPFCAPNTPSPGLITFSPVIQTLYNDVQETDIELCKQLENDHIGTAMSIFATPIPAPLWSDKGLSREQRVYIKPLRDNVFPPQAQDLWLEQCGVEWTVREVDGSHCAFIARAKEVADIVLDAAKTWTA